MVELSSVRVKRKGRPTVPVELRRKHQIREGSILEVREPGDGTFVKPAARVEAGKVVGKEIYQEIIHDLDRLRRKWR